LGGDQSPNEVTQVLEINADLLPASHKKIIGPKVI